MFTWTGWTSTTSLFMRRSTGYSDRLHDFSVTLPDDNDDEWWWNVFEVWLTDEWHLALFPAGTIVRDSHHLESPTSCKQDLNLPRTCSGFVKWSCAVVLTTTLWHHKMLQILDVTRTSMSKVSLIAQLDSGILCL